MKEQLDKIKDIITDSDEDDEFDRQDEPANIKQATTEKKDAYKYFMEKQGK